MSSNHHPACRSEFNFGNLIARGRVERERSSSGDQPRAGRAAPPRRPRPPSIESRAGPTVFLKGCTLNPIQLTNNRKVSAVSLRSTILSVQKGTTGYRIRYARTKHKNQIASSILPTRPAARISFSLSCISRSSDTSPVNMVQNEPIVRPSHLTGAPR